MTLVYGPSATALADGYTNIPTAFYSGTFNTGTVFTFAWTSVTVPSGWTHAGWQVTILKDGHLIDHRDFNAAFPQGANGFTYTAPSAGGYAFYAQGGGGYATSLFGTINALQLDATTHAYCEYGTELQPTSQFVYYLTPALIEAWLVADGSPFLALLFQPFWFTTFKATELCGEGPPPLPVIDMSTLDASLETIYQILKVVAWPNLCRCKDGATTPIPYPLPAPTQPPGWPAAPSFDCSNADICATLLQVQAQLAAVQKTTTRSAELVQLIQRYHVPFATIAGAAHTLASGTGQFAISRLIGIRVEITTPPSGGLELEGNPHYVWNQGWMSISDVNGMLLEKRISQTQLNWLPDEFQQATIFKFALRDGVVATFTELEAEP